MIFLYNLNLKNLGITLNVLNLIKNSKSRQALTCFFLLPSYMLGIVIYYLQNNYLFISL